MTNANNKWTLVQHSGSHKPGFERAVEETVLTTKGDIAKVVRAGGIVFDTYEAAAEAEYNENYPPEVQSFHPRCRGAFSTTKLYNRRIYIPVPS